MTCTWAFDWRLIGALLAGLFCFGLAYNALVTWLGERKVGYVAFLVVTGVLVTLGAFAFVSWPCALLILAFFSASGTPMIIGDIVRTVRAREAQMRKLQELYDVEKT